MRSSSLQWGWTFNRSLVPSSLDRRGTELNHSHLSNITPCSKHRLMLRDHRVQHREHSQQLSKHRRETPHPHVLQKRVDLFNTLHLYTFELLLGCTCKDCCCFFNPTSLTEIQIPHNQIQAKDNVTTYAKTRINVATTAVSFFCPQTLHCSIDT